MRTINYKMLPTLSSVSQPDRLYAERSDGVADLSGLQRSAKLWISLLCLLCFGCQEYPNAYKMTDGKPEVFYVRLPDVAAADSLLDGAFLGNTICIVGNNLRSVYELYFNDRKAILNTSLMTDHTLIVSLPGDIPEIVTDNMYLHTKKGEIVAYPFRSKVPAPVVSAISCEYALDGWEATIYGDFLIDDANVPLKISMGGNVPVTEILDVRKTQVRFVIPEGAQKGYINVETIYGTGRSHFQFRDDRGMILDWDNLNADGGWRSGNLADVDGISGKYVVFKGNLNDDTWDEDGFSFNLWGIENGRPEGDFFNASASNLDRLLFKFEINVLKAWSSCAMQIIFTPWDVCNTNGYIGDSPLHSRALWIPWITESSYKTDGWITVTIPMTEFKYDAEGKVIDRLGPGNYGGLTMYVWNGGIDGTPCSPEMWIDNIRVVPAE